MCSGAVSLATAQHAIATNWFTAYLLYVGVATPAPTTTAAYIPPPAPPTAEPPTGATGLCNDGTYSYALHHQGMCSHHGGVKEYYS